MPEEKALLARKYIQPRIQDMEAVKLPLHAKALLVRIHTITGWRLPESDDYLLPLVSEFTRYLVERCGDLNPEEIAYAFRNHSLEVKDWGKSMNLSLIDEPIREYRIKRRELSEIEERASIDQKQGKIVELPAGECDWSKEWGKVKQWARNGKINSAIIVTPIYDWLDRQGMIELSNSDKRQLMEDCKSALVAELQIEISEGRSTPQMTDMLKKLKSDEWRQDEGIRSRLITMSKIQAVKELAISEAL